MAKNTNNADNPNKADCNSNTSNIIISRTETVYCIISINNKDSIENSIENSKENSKENLSEIQSESPETYKTPLESPQESPQERHKDSYIINIQNIFRSEYTEQRRNNKFNK